MNSGQDDINAFNSWDCFGATLMLAAVPAAMNYVFTEEHEIGSTIGIMAIGLIIALVVLAVALITRWKLLSKIINGLGLALTICYTAYTVGCILTPVYVVITICAFWFPDEEPKETEAKQEQVQPAEANK